jgi:hypothetical protein
MGCIAAKPPAGDLVELVLPARRILRCEIFPTASRDGQDFKNLSPRSAASAGIQRARTSAQYSACPDRHAAGARVAWRLSTSGVPADFRPGHRHPMRPVRRSRRQSRRSHTSSPIWPTRGIGAVPCLAGKTAAATVLGSRVNTTPVTLTTRNSSNPHKPRATPRGFVPRGLSYAKWRPKLFTAAEWRVWSRAVLASCRSLLLRRSAGIDPKQSIRRPDPAPEIRRWCCWQAKKPVWQPAKTTVRYQGWPGRPARALCSGEGMSASACMGIFGIADLYGLLGVAPHPGRERRPERTGSRGERTTATYQSGRDDQPRRVTKHAGLGERERNTPEKFSWSRIYFRSVFAGIFRLQFCASKNTGASRDFSHRPPGLPQRAPPSERTANGFRVLRSAPRHA